MSCPSLRLWGKLIVGIGFALLLARCGIKASPPSGTFTAVYTTTISTACVQCHQAGGSAEAAGVHLDFTSQTAAYNGLTGGAAVASTGESTPSTCQGVLLVKAGDATLSYLAGTLFGDYNIPAFAGKSGCTPYPHFTTANINLSSAEEASIIAWIQAGALNN